MSPKTEELVTRARAHAEACHSIAPYKTAALLYELAAALAATPSPGWNEAVEACAATILARMELYGPDGELACKELLSCLEALVKDSGKP